MSSEIGIMIEEKRIYTMTKRLQFEFVNKAKTAKISIYNLVIHER